MKNQIVTQNKPDVSISYLTKLGVSENEIMSGIQNNMEGKSKNWKCTHLSATSDILIDFNSLPQRLTQSINTGPNSETNIKDDNLLGGGYLIELLHAYKVGYKDYLDKFIELSEGLRNKYARKLAVFTTCGKIYLELQCKKGVKKKIYFSLRRLGISYYTTKSSFNRKFRSFLDSHSPVEIILHNAINKQKPKKITEWQRLKIMDLMGQGLLKSEILKEINSKCNPKEEISYTTLLTNISTEMKNITAEKRYGYSFYKKFLEPYILRQKPEFKYQVVEIDGSRFQLVYVDENGKLRFLKLFVILDVYSSMILGFSLAEEETTEMVKEAFHMCFNIHKIVPACIISDKSSAITSHDFNEFKETTNLLFGTLWREHLPDFPNAKGTVENFFRNFHIQIARKYSDYVGLGITAISHDHKIKKEHVKFLKSNKHKLKSKKELVHFAYELINQWNTSIGKNGSPQQKHKQGKTRDAKKIAPEIIARLCWRRTSCKVNKSRIRFRNKEYEIADFDNRTKWNNKIIDIYYHPNIQEFIFLFNDLQFIEKAKLKKLYSEEDPSKFAKIRSNKTYRKHLNGKYKENKKRLEELEFNDPVIDLIYEPNKTVSNQQFEKFFDENYLEKEIIEEKSLDVHELPNLEL